MCCQKQIPICPSSPRPSPHTCTEPDHRWGQSLKLACGRAAGVSSGRARAAQSYSGSLGRLCGSSVNTGNAKLAQENTTTYGFETKVPGRSLQPVTHKAQGCWHQPQESEGHTQHVGGTRPWVLTALQVKSHSLSSVISRNWA